MGCRSMSNPSWDLSFLSWLLLLCRGVHCCRSCLSIWPSKLRTVCRWILCKTNREVLSLCSVFQKTNTTSTCITPSTHWELHTTTAPSCTTGNDTSPRMANPRSLRRMEWVTSDQLLRLRYDYANLRHLSSRFRRVFEMLACTLRVTFVQSWSDALHSSISHTFPRRRLVTEETCQASTSSKWNCFTNAPPVEAGAETEAETETVAQEVWRTSTAEICWTTPAYHDTINHQLIKHCQSVGRSGIWSVSCSVGHLVHCSFMYPSIQFIQQRVSQLALLSSVGSPSVSYSWFIHSSIYESIHPFNPSLIHINRAYSLYFGSHTWLFSVVSFTDWLIYSFAFAGNCNDLKSSCPYWAKKGYCQGQYETYMNTYCKKSCNKCGEISNLGNW